MGNILEFIMKITDQLSPAMRQAASVVDSSTARIQKDFQQAGQSVNSVGREIDELKSKASGFSLGNIIGGNLISNGLTGIITGAFSAAKGFIADSISGAMEQGMTKKSFNVLTGSEATGNALFGDIKQFVQDSVFGPELYKDAQTMLGFGVATKDVMKDLHMLGDVSMGNAERMQSLTLAFSQTTAAGKLMGQDLLQYINAGFNPLSVMSEKWQQFGFKSQKSIGDLKELMSKGGISSEMVAKAFELATGEGGKYNHMLDQMAQTAGGKWAAITGSFEGFKADVGTALEPLTMAVLNILDGLMKIGQNALPYITEGAKWILDAFSGITSGTSEWSIYLNVIREQAGYVWEVIKSVGANIWHIISGVVDWIKKSELLQDIFWLLGKAGEVVWWAVKKIGDVLSWIWDNTIKPILNAIDWVYSKVKSLLGFGSNKTELTVATTTKISGAPKLDPVSGNASKAPGAATSSKSDVGGKADAINSGGQRTITIHIGKQIEKVEMHVATAREGVDELAQMIREEVRRVLYSVNGMATN